MSLGYVVQRMEILGDGGFGSAFCDFGSTFGMPMSTLGNLSVCLTVEGHANHRKLNPFIPCRMIEYMHVPGR